jgi:hypothetical protein
MGQEVSTVAEVRLPGSICPNRCPEASRSGWANVDDIPSKATRAVGFDSVLLTNENGGHPRRMTASVKDSTMNVETKSRNLSRGHD